MSIRTALIGGTCLLLLLTTGVLTFVGIRAIHDNVVREAQTRVDRDLVLLANFYETELVLSRERLLKEIQHLGLAEALAGEDAVDPERVHRELLRAKEALGFAVIGLVGPDGGPVTGESRNGRQIEPGPVIRTALQGRASHGTRQLNRTELQSEGGESLLGQLRVPIPPGTDGDEPDGALFQWCAAPILARDGEILGAVYGGRPLNHDHELVDRLAQALFGEELYEGKPVGTVTIFLGDTRVATNVRGRDGQRAIGTRVSDVVREHVLVRSERWRSRAWVVDSWYLSGYEPLLDPEGRTLGMLYVGLLEAPYDELQTRAIRGFVLPALALLLLAGLGAGFVVERITRPLEQLRRRTDRIADGEWNQPLESNPAYTEIRSLSDALANMQNALSRRDRQLREKNEELSQYNTDLAVANENYMETLAFVTHEIRAPLANVQALTELVLDGHGGQIEERGRDLLVRILRNCVDLQGMVRDYLDLSRAERGGLVPKMQPMELQEDVIEPAASLASALLEGRGMTLEVESAGPVSLVGDPELLRIALGNYLGNAAKYGREGGRVLLTVQRADGTVAIAVWNEGPGFSPEERARLFGKFSRLMNANTKAKKGSGLGLYITGEVARQHDGEVWAESEPGAWARFGLRLPLPSTRSAASSVSIPPTGPTAS